MKSLSVDSSQALRVSAQTAEQRNAANSAQPAGSCFSFMMETNVVFFLFVFFDDGDKLELSIRNSGMCMKHKLSSVFCCSACFERKTAVITGVFVKHTQ